MAAPPNRALTAAGIVAAAVAIAATIVAVGHQQTPSGQEPTPAATDRPHALPEAPARTEFTGAAERAVAAAGYVPGETVEGADYGTVTIVTVGTDHVAVTARPTGAETDPFDSVSTADIAGVTVHLGTRGELPAGEFTCGPYRYDIAGTDPTTVDDVTVALAEAVASSCHDRPAAGR